MMEILTVESIEDYALQLPLADQLRLMETLVGQIRRRGLVESSNAESQLAAMAHDPEVQRELRAIEADFAGGETDGLAIA